MGLHVNYSRRNVADDANQRLSFMYRFSHWEVDHKEKEKGYHVAEQHRGF